MCLACDAAEEQDLEETAGAGAGHRHGGSGLSRRWLLAGLAGGALLSAAPMGPAAGAKPPDRTLRLYRYHSGEKLTATYFRDGKYVDAVLKQINTMCRDLLEKEETVMDVHLLDFLFAVSKAVDPEAVVEIISAYRSPKTNAFLRSKSSNVAEKSKHMKGEAIDVRIRGAAPESVADTAAAMKRGGVGLYVNSGFVHLDSGRPRHWVITPEDTATARVIQLRPRPRPAPRVAAMPKPAPMPMLNALDPHPPTAPTLIRSRPSLRPFAKRS